MNGPRKARYMIRFTPLPNPLVRVCGAGQGQVIKGWDQGVATMRLGEKAMFTLRSDYAYGESGSGEKIPPGATLKFEVELLRLAHKVMGYPMVMAMDTGMGIGVGSDFRLNWVAFLMLCPIADSASCWFWKVRMVACLTNSSSKGLVGSTRSHTTRSSSSAPLRPALKTLPSLPSRRPCRWDRKGFHWV